MRIAIIAIAAICITPQGQAVAGERCDVSVTEWQPRETLKSKLESEGWQVQAITSWNGCYKVDGIDRTGAAVHALFDPKSLIRVDAKATTYAG